MDIVIVGAGDFGREILQYCRDCIAAGLEAQIKGFLDDAAAEIGHFHPDVPVLGTIADYTPSGEHERFVIAIGSTPLRRELGQRLRLHGRRFVSIVHPSAYVAPTATLASGCVICPFAFVAPFAQLAEDVVLNTYASVGHDTRVGAGSVLSPYAVINGRVTLETDVFLGTQSAVTAGCSIGHRSKIAAGAVATRDCPPGFLLAGNPAKGRMMFKTQS